MQQIKNILIPTDYSENAGNATNFGMGLAQKIGAEVILFHSYHIPLTSSEDMMYIAQMKDGEVEKLERQKEVLFERYPDVPISAVVEYGSVVDHIASISKEKKVDLIIMGTKGETGNIEAILGSIASNVINQVKCNTLIIPEETHSFELDEVMIATDFHENVKSSLYGPLFQILEKMAAAVTVVNVKNRIGLTEIPSRTEIETDNLFGAYKHSHHFIESENVEEALFDFANLNNVDMMVILTKHYSLWQRLWHKSMAKKLALHTTIPLFIIHEDA